MILQTDDIIKTAEQYRCIDGRLRVLGGLYLQQFCQIFSAVCFPVIFQIVISAFDITFS